MTWESNTQAPGITSGCFMRKQSVNQALRKNHEAVELLLGQDPSWDFLRRTVPAELLTNAAGAAQGQWVTTRTQRSGQDSTEFTTVPK